MNKDKVNELQLLGTIKNADESGIIVYANQVFDSKAGKSVEERITDVANTVSTNASNAATKTELTAEANRAKEAEITSVTLEGTNLVFKNSSNKQIGDKVDLAKFQVSDQFVDEVRLVSDATKDKIDSQYATEHEDEIPYIYITFQYKAGVDTDEPKAKEPIRVSVKEIWDVTNAGDLVLGNYSKGSDSSAVANTDSVSKAIGKLENKIDAKANATSLSSKQNKLKTYTEDTSSTTPTVKISDVTDGSNKMGLNSVSIEANANGGTVVLLAGDGQGANKLTLKGNTQDGILKLGDKTVATTDQIPTETQIKAIKVNSAEAADDATNLTSAPSIAAGTTNANAITVTAGNKKSGEFTVPYAKNAGSASTASSATTAGSATKATQDADGNVITSTYLTKTSASTTYATQTTVNSLTTTVGTKANTADVYSKTAADGKFATKADVTANNLTATAVGTKTYDVATIDSILGN